MKNLSIKDNKVILCVSITVLLILCGGFFSIRSIILQGLNPAGIIGIMGILLIASNLIILYFLKSIQLVSSFLIIELTLLISTNLLYQKDLTIIFSYFIWVLALPLLIFFLMDYKFSLIFTFISSCFVIAAIIIKHILKIFPRIISPSSIEIVPIFISFFMFFMFEVIICLIFERARNKIYKKMLTQSAEKELITEELKKSILYTDYIIKSMLDALLVISSEGKITFANESAIKLLGYSSGELINKKIESIIYNDTNDTIEDDFLLEEKINYNSLVNDKKFNLNSLINKENNIKEFNTLYKTKNGEFIPVVISCSIMNGKAKEPSGAVIVGKDMREIRVLIGKLKTAYQELRDSTINLVQTEKMSALGELTAGIAHELNQPLNMISIICQSILRDIEKERFKQESLEAEMNNVIGQIKKMSSIINHMRIFTRQTDASELEMADINTIILNTLKLSEQQLKNHNISLVKELTSRELKIVCHPIRLEQVLLNLLSNAHHAVLSSGKKEMIINIKTYSDEGEKYAVFEISDNGTGISDYVKEKLFHPFFTTKDPGKGTGLGLSVTKKLIEEHNGKIEVESTKGEGSTFKVFLPLLNNNIQSGEES